MSTTQKNRLAVARRLDKIRIKLAEPFLNLLPVKAIKSAKTKTIRYDLT